MKRLILYFLILCLICGCSNSSVENTKEVSSITTDSVFSMIERDGVYIIDVRQEYEYRNGHIENAYNIPLAEINRIKSGDIPLDSVVIVYCQSGNRSKKAAEILLDLGYENVFDMGGINLWEYGLITD